MSRNHDVIVIGGGPAGSTCASYMAMKGHKVLLIEKELFPRHRVGESLLPSTNPILEELGVLEKMEEVGFPHKTGGSFTWGKDDEPWSVIFAENPFLPASFGYHVERSIFDEILLNRSIELGVNVVQPATVKEIIVENGRVMGVHYKTSDGEIVEARARFVVDGSGPASVVGKKMTMRTYDDRMRQTAVYAYFKGAAGEPEGQEGHVVVTTTEKGWFWYIPMNSEKLGNASIGFVTGQEFNKELSEKGAERFFYDALESTPRVKAMLGEAATQVGKVRGIKDWAFVCDELAGPGFFLAGDAAAFIDPLLSTGVTLAMIAGYTSSICMNSILKNPEMEEQAVEFYDGNYKRMYSVTRDALLYFYSGNDIDSEGVFWQARKLMKFGDNACAKQSFSHLVNTVAANPHPSAKRQIHMFHQFVDKMEHPVEDMATEREFEVLVESKSSSDAELSPGSFVVVNGTLSSTCVIESDTHTLKPVRGIMFDEDRPVFSSTASWLLGKNFSEMNTEALSVLDLLHNDRCWSEVLEMWGKQKGMSVQSASASISPIVRALLDERFVRIRK